jgi:peptidoglycan/xylan/chitin deacetylase (PgdA/CDA1 family)
VSGDVTLSASSSDNIGVVGVKFFVDAVQQGSEDLASPYSMTWSTLSSTNGAHVVTTVARDAAGNTATATSTVTVNNSVATTTNLIANPSVETGTTLPTGWAQGGWGTNNRVLSYPVAGQDGAKAVAMTITTFTDGDAKWYFNPVNIATGTSYTYSDYYKSDVGTALTARYTLVGGTFSYVFLGNVPAAANWTKTSVQFVPPANATAVTIFHALSSVGTLSVDNFSLAPSSGVNPNTFANGMVSLSFDDGWVSHYTTVMPMLNAAGLKGSFGIITSYMLNTVPANPISNFSLEATGTASTPQDWFKGGWGTNDAVLTWPVAGFSGAKAAQLSITTYTDGDAKWYFKDVSVVDGQKFTFSDYYKSTATSTITARYYMGSSTYVYAQLAVVPPSQVWATQPVQFTVPGNVQSMTIFHALSSVGSLTIDLANLDDGNPQPYVSSGQVLDMQASGHEIDSHTQTHVSLSTVPVGEMQSQISGSRSDLLGIGVTAPEILVYPYGDYNAAVEQTAQTAGFIGARSVDRGFNLKNTDKYALKVQQIDMATPLSQLEAWVDQAKQDKTWLIFMFHQVDTGGEQLSISPFDLQTLVNYIKASGVTVPTIREGVQQMAL